MHDIHAVIAMVEGLDEERLWAWVEERLVQPAEAGGEMRFREVDVARLRLLVTLGEDLAVDAEALPVVIRLLDQIHGLRRALRTLGEAVARQPEEVRADIRATIAALDRRGSGG